MSDQFVGEIRMFAGRYAPVGWVFCDGRTLPINQNELLYAVLGAIYGGDGTSTFAVPDLRGKLPVGQGTGPGLTARALGQSFGKPGVTLNATQIPAHTHAFNAAKNGATAASPDGALLAAPAPSSVNLYAAPAQGKQTATLAPNTVTGSGQAQPAAHSNMMQSLSVNFIIATQGFFPSQY